MSAILCRRILSMLLVGLFIAGTLQSRPASAQESPSDYEQSNPVVLVGDSAQTTSVESTLQIGEETTLTVLRVDLHVTNTSASLIDAERLTPVIEVYDQASRIWPLEQQDLVYDINPVPQGGSFSVQLTATNTNILAYNGPVFVRVRDLPDPETTTFAVWYLNGVAEKPERLPVNPLKNTQAPVGARNSNASVSIASAEPVNLDIDALIPTLEELPTGLWTVNQGKLNQSAIASTFTDPGMADRFLNDWGWQENAFIYLEGAPTIEGLVYVDVGIHRFANESAALQAMEYYVVGRAEVMNMWEIADVEPGDHFRTITNGTDTTAYAVTSNVVVRVSVAGSNPSPFAAQIREKVLQKARMQSSVIGITRTVRNFGEDQQ